MEFKQITNKEDWDKQIGSQVQSQFLQSWDWGIFQKSLDRQVWYLGINGDNLLVIKMSLPYNKNYLYIPRTGVKFNQEIVEILKKLGKEQKSLFIRVEPIKQGLLELGFKKTNSVQPGKTLYLDLSKSEEDLLLAMHQKTRYNIRLAAKKGVKVRQGTQENINDFYDLISNTYNRKGISVYQKEYYQKLLENYPEAKIYLAEFEGKVLCANLITFFGDTVTYLHGGSSEENRNLMAPHLLQWEVIKLVKELGYKYYDFWGIDEKYGGVARFKKGFSDYEVEYSGCYDYVLDKLWYYAYQVVKKFK